MTVEERTTVMEVVDILQTLGGNNGFGNLQPRIKMLLKGYAKKLRGIAERDALQNQSAEGTMKPSAKEAFLMNH